MKKKILCIVIVLPLVLILSFATMDYIQKISGEGMARVEKIERYAESGQWEMAEKEMENLSAFWEEKEKLLQIWVCHQDTDAVRQSLLLTRVSLESRELPEVLRNGALLNDALDHLHHRDDAHFSNIL